jgi:hypothetical protein
LGEERGRRKADVRRQERLRKSEKRMEKIGNILDRILAYRYDRRLIMEA